MTRKQLEKMTNNQLIAFAMKLENNMITKQTELINSNKEVREKLGIIDAKSHELKKESEWRAKYQLREKPRWLF